MAAAQSSLASSALRTSPRNAIVGSRCRTHCHQAPSLQSTCGHKFHTMTRVLHLKPRAPFRHPLKVDEESIGAGGGAGGPGAAADDRLIGGGGPDGGGACIAGSSSPISSHSLEWNCLELVDHLHIFRKKFLGPKYLGCEGSISRLGTCEKRKTTVIRPFWRLSAG